MPWSSPMSVIESILSSTRTVFTLQYLSVLNSDKDPLSLRKSLLYYVQKGLLLDTDSKRFVKSRLVQETADALQLFAAYPLLARQIPTRRMQLIDTHPDLLQRLREQDIDLSMVTEQQLVQLYDHHQSIILHTRQGKEVSFAGE